MFLKQSTVNLNVSSLSKLRSISLVASDIHSRNLRLSWRSFDIPRNAHLGGLDLYTASGRIGSAKSFSHSLIGHVNRALTKVSPIGVYVGSSHVLLSSYR